MKKQKKRLLLISAIFILPFLLFVSCSQDHGPVVSDPVAPIEEDLTPADLSANSANSVGNDFRAKVLYSEGTSIYFRAGQQPGALQQDLSLQKGDALLLQPGAELEIDVQSPGITDGVIHTRGAAYVTLDQTAPPRRSELSIGLLTGRMSFFLPSLAQSVLTITTPLGVLETRGGIFTVAISPQKQLLVTCREGSVVLTGAQESAAVPGKVLVVDAPGGGRQYSIKPDNALKFQERWMKVMEEEAPEYFRQEKDQKIEEWNRVWGDWNHWMSLQSTASPGVRMVLTPLENLLVWMAEAKRLLKDSEIADLPSGEKLTEAWRQVSKIRNDLAGKASPWMPVEHYPGLMGREP